MSYERPEKRPFSEKGLTPETMLTDPGYRYFRDKTTCSHDVSIMNREQLDKYMRMAFLEQEDETFLPAPFWNDAYYGISGSGDGRLPDGATKFFAHMYEFVGNVHYWYGDSDVPAERSWIGYPVHVEYRQNFYAVIMGIIDECEAVEAPSEEQIRLAMCVVDAMIWLAIGQGASPEDYTKPDITLFQRAAKLAQDPRYAEAWSKVERPTNLGWLTTYVDEYGEYEG